MNHHDTPKAGDEETASRMAERAVAALDSGDEAAFSAALDALSTYLAVDLDSVFTRQEAEAFPLLETRGLTEEVREAKRQHRDLRRLASHLASAAPSSTASARHLLGAVARLLAPH